MTFLLALTVMTVNLTAYAQTRACYDTSFQLTYASDTNQYINVSGAPLDMNESLQGITLDNNNAYYRVLNKSDKVLFDKLYNILVYSNGYILAKSEGKFGLIDNNGKLIHDFQYESIKVLNDGQAILTTYVDGQLSAALVNNGDNDERQRLYPKSKSYEAGLDIIGVYYDNDSKQGYFQVNKEGKSGLIDNAGRIIIPAIYDEMESLEYCASDYFIMKVKLNDQIGLINQNNQFVVPLRAKQSIDIFNSGAYAPYILSVKSASQGIADVLHWSPNKADVVKETLVSSDGQVLLTSDSPIESLGGDLYRFSHNGKFGVINHWAERVLGAYYDNIIYENDSPLIAERAGKFGIIYTNQSGDTLKIPRYFDSLERVQNKKVIAAFIRSISDNESDDVIVVDEDSAIELEINRSFLVGSNDIEHFASNSIEHDYYDNRSPQAYIASRNNKYGVISSYNNSQIIIPFDYQSIKQIGELFIVEQSGKYGVLDFEGNIVQPAIFDTIQDSERDFLILDKNDQQAVMSVAGEIILPLSDIKLRMDMMEYARAQIPVEQNGLFGYLNKARTAVAIEPTYESVELIYDNDNFIGQKQGTKQLIDVNNKIVKVKGSTKYHIIENTVANDKTAFIATFADIQGIVDANAEVVLPFDYDSIEPFFARQYDQDSDSYNSSRYFIVKHNGLFGILDKNLKIVILPTYKHFRRLNSQPYFVIASDSKKLMKYGLVDIKGNVVRQMHYDAISIDPDNSEYIIMKKGSEVEYYSEKIALGLDLVIEEAF